MGQNPLSYYILYNESKPNILGLLVGKANKQSTQQKGREEKKEQRERERGRVMKKRKEKKEEKTKEGGNSFTKIEQRRSCMWNYLE
jgi:hypothetical protein